MNIYTFIIIWVFNDRFNFDWNDRAETNKIRAPSVKVIEIWFQGDLDGQPFSWRMVVLALRLFKNLCYFFFMDNLWFTLMCIQYKFAFFFVVYN